MKTKLLLLISFLLISSISLFSQGYLGKTISQVKEKMKNDYPNVKIGSVTNKQGNITLFQEMTEVQQLAFFNNKGICNLEKMYPLTDAATAQILLVIKSTAYTNYYDSKIDIHIYKIRVSGKGIIEADFLVDNKGHYVFELYYLNSKGEKDDL